MSPTDSDRMALLAEENQRLHLQLQEAEETLSAIRSGQVDALLVQGEAGDRVFTLKGAEHGYRLFVETMHEGAVTLRADGLILYANMRFSLLIGVSLEKVIGAYLHAFVAGAHQQRLAVFLAAEEDRRQEFSLLGSHGESVPVVLAIAQGFVEEESAGMCMIVTDLREQKTIEQLRLTQAALELSQSHLNVALETARLGSWKLELGSGNITCSPRCLANYGLAAGTAFDFKTLESMIHPSDLPQVRALLEKSIQGKSVFESEYRIRWPDGSLHWIIASGHTTFNAGGAPEFMIGVSLNITDRKQIEEALKESEKRYRVLAEAIPQLSWTCRPDGYCDYLSQQWIDYTGRPMEEQLGDKWLLVLHPDDKDLALRSWKNAVTKGGGYDLEYRILGADGQFRWFKTRGIPLQDENGVVIKWFGTCTEIEDIVQARNVLNRDKENLEELVKQRTASLHETTEQLNNFCYSIAHDLRAPLRAQQGYAQVILEDYGDLIGPAGKHSAQRIVTAAEKLEKLVQDLLSHVSLSRGDLPLERVEIRNVIKQVCGDLDELIRKNQAEVEIGSVDGFVVAHGASLNLILSNLLSNAVKYTKANETPHIGIWSEEGTNTVKIWVSDKGIGIKPEYQEKIFGVFQRLHSPEVYPGTGIGLALVKRGVERMSGHTGVVSTPGEGSQFWIELPKA